MGPDDCYVGTGKGRYNSKDINLIHGNGHGQSCEKMYFCARSNIKQTSSSKYPKHYHHFEQQCEALDLFISVGCNVLNPHPCLIVSRLSLS